MKNQSTAATARGPFRRPRPVALPTVRVWLGGSGACLAQIGSTTGTSPMRKLVIGLAAVGVATAGSVAHATTATSNFQVRITITAQCLAATTNDLDFGSPGFLSSDVLAQSSISVQCTNTTPYNVGFDQ